MVDSLIEMLPRTSSRTLQCHTPMDEQRRNALSHVLRADTDLHFSAPDPHEDIDPNRCMKLLLEHVELDADGGILNLGSQASAHKQHDKLMALRKDNVEKVLGMLAALRAIANPIIVLHNAVLFLWGYYFREEWIKKLEKIDTSMKFPIPIGLCFALTSIAELVGISFLLLRAARHVQQALRWSSDAVKDKFNPSYKALALFFWYDVPKLQSFSAMAALAFVHPSLLTKSAKTFSLSEDVARAKLEAFLRGGENQMTDETIVMKVISLVVNYDHKDDPDRKKAVASHYLERKPLEVLKLLQKSPVASDRPFLERRGLDPDAIFGWRFNCVLYVEGFTFVLFVILCLLTGTMGLLVNMTRCVAYMLDPAIDLFYAITFFLGFLNQSIGIVSITQLLRWRVECLLFGGSDARVSSEESFITRYYLGSLNEAVWKNNDLSPFDKMCVMLQFDDDDLQQLVVEDHFRAKAHLVLKVRNYMHQTHDENLLKEKIIDFAK